jgi:hypothetical protein
METNFGFIYRYLVGDTNAPITALTFKSYEEFKALAEDVLDLYKDFKTTFLNAVAA